MFGERQLAASALRRRTPKPPAIPLDEEDAGLLACAGCRQSLLWRGYDAQAAGGVRVSSAEAPQQRFVGLRGR